MNKSRLLGVVCACAATLVLSTNVNAATITVDGSWLNLSSNANATAVSTGQLSDTDERSRSATIGKFDASLGELTSAYLTYTIDTSFHYDSRINGDWSTTQLYYQGSTVNGQHSLNYTLSLEGANLESGNYSSSSGATSSIETGETYTYYCHFGCGYTMRPAWKEYSPANWISTTNQKEVVVDLLNYFDTTELTSLSGLDVLSLQLDHSSNLVMNCLLYSNSKDCWSSTQSQGSVVSSITYNYNEVSAVPVPAAVWLFGSGLLGLVGMARRKKAA